MGRHSPMRHPVVFLRWMRLSITRSWRNQSTPFGNLSPDDQEELARILPLCLYPARTCSRCLVITFLSLGVRIHLCSPHAGVLGDVSTAVRRSLGKAVSDIDRLNRWWLKSRNTISPTSPSTRTPRR